MGITIKGVILGDGLIVGWRVRVMVGAGWLGCVGVACALHNPGVLSAQEVSNALMMVTWKMYRSLFIAVEKIIPAGRIST